MYSSDEALICGGFKDLDLLFTGYTFTLGTGTAEFLEIL